ncbi:MULTISPECIES: UDP-N-acetylmuramoyl-L-alanine--D-glutamate ligase [unclassified Acidovorax]|uniref:UDP-N-acetylmuramoyl-L-alanine--D-glutamate ligase n=1 Tax=unclassified Acidovorax TaxID=2684926 RepID=UPI001C44D1BC|nr:MULTISPECIES: UDP-N-acetylmuramoyl-L-alanine--D-glutamate ligase [unclassified Acidovorax]MBV7428660.1 UDP-N-acetylmuramoyl-L-alanine--D-glutamate ligase [Acidovorax sp. sif0732]MBV7450486.1 UDP-N-acetylmuramoyl-L-alanine--D-glutamate ligase [Acidovorax sp. sif0715]
MNPDDPLIPAAPADPPVAATGMDAPAGTPEVELPPERSTADVVPGDPGVTDVAGPGALSAAEPMDATAGAAEPAASADGTAGAPGPATGARAANAAANAWDPEKPPAVSAAKAAADFVAQIFAEVAAPEAASALPQVADEEEATQDAPADGPAEPLGRPGEGLRPLLGQKILILGLGASGLAMARWCVRCGAEVTVADTRAAPPQLAVLQQELPQVRFVAGAFDASLVEGQDLHAVYRSPGLSPQTIAPVLVAASACGISAGGELSLYSMALGALKASHGYAPAVLAITGTNGKTTVTSLTGQLVERSGQSVAVAGNIGPTLLDTLASHIDAGTLPEVWVLELSSFQLDGVTGFEPTAATVLNITQDHLDWHGDMAAYAAAKARIFGQAGLMILNREDAAVMQMLPPPVKVKLQKPQVREHLTFGADMPQRPGDFGIEVVSGMPWLVRAMDADETRKRGRNEAAEDLHIQRLMPADALRIRGRHNAVNALAALALASAAGCTLAPLLYGLREYRGEPHRVEPVAIIHGVEYFDDSKGTNVGATVAALTGLGAERRIVVILGGDGKGQDFSPLAAPVARHARAVVLIGRDAPQIRAALQDSGVALVDAETLPQAVELASQRAHAGDAVLMSPACASFDMFRGYEHRAQVFCDTVHALADDATGGAA